MLVDKVAFYDERHAQVERVLRSECFRSSEVLRRLLAYLAEKESSGEADQLKEYVIAIEGLGKPTSYDPQQNSTVRIQVGRLRQKLAEYYRTEGVHDPLLVDLPKGRFRLTYEQRSSLTNEPLHSSETVEALELPGPSPSIIPNRQRWTNALFGFVAGILLMIAGYFAFHLLHGLTANSNGTVSTWSTDVEELWKPFALSGRPLVLSIEDPLFVEVQSNPGIYYRDRSLNKWNDVQSSSALKQLSKSLNRTNLQPSRYYTAFGEAEAVFYLGGLLRSHVQSISIMRTSQLSWHQLADNNIVFVGVQNLFFEQLQGMPVASELVANLEGVKNTHPAPGEPSFFKDEYVTAPTEQGIVYALVTRVSGPMRSNDILSFTSVRSPGYVGAVRFFTSSDTAKTVVNRLKASNNGKMPRAYQVLLKVLFKDDVPTETTYVLGRVLQ